MNGDTKKLIIVGGSIIGGLLLVILILYIVSNSNHYIDYTQFEETLYNAANKYYKENPSELPSVDGEYTLSYDTLVQKNILNLLINY